jgi:hypothetical protein
MRFRFKIGDKVHILSKSAGDPLSEVKRRRPEFNHTGYIRELSPDYGIDYVVTYRSDAAGGDFYQDVDLEPFSHLEKDLFEI